MYYLQSRYYDPQIGRFINVDSYVSTGQGILGDNMFAYCLNNPVNYFDSSGEFASAVVLWALTSGLAAGAVSALVAWGTGGSSEDILNEFYWGFGLGVIGSAGGVGTAISLGIGALRAYSDSRESGTDIEHSFYTAVVTTAFSLPFPSTGSQGEDLLLATAFGGYLSLVSTAASMEVQEVGTSNRSEAARNKTTFYHNVRSLTSIGGSIGIMNTSFILGGGNQYVRI